MSNRHIEPSIPGLFAIILEIPFFLILGALIGAVILVYRPVEVVAITPDYPEPNVVYYRTPVGGLQARDVSLKLMALRAGRPERVEVSEAEINSWAASSFAALKDLTDKEREQEVAVSKVELGAPGVRIEKDNVDMVLIVRSSFFKRPVTDLPFQMSGKLTTGDGKVNYTAESIYLGSLPLHKLPGAGEYVQSWIWNIIGQGENVEEMRQILEKTKRVETKSEQNSLVFYF